MSDELVKRLREGVIEHPNRWTGDTHDDLGGSVDCDATDTLMMQAADRIESLEAEIELLHTAGIAEIAARNPQVMEYMQHWETRAEKAEADAREAYTRGMEDAAKVVGEKSDAARKKLGQCVSEGHPEDEHVWSAIVSHLDLAHSSIRARAALNWETDT